MFLHSYPPSARLRSFCRFLKIGVLECRRHPVDFDVLDAYLLGDQRHFDHLAQSGSCFGRTSIVHGTMTKYFFARSAYLAPSGVASSI